MPLWAVLVWLAVWQLAAWWVDAPILLVSPLTALKRLLELAFEAAFWRAVGFSVGRILLGFLLSALLGVALAAAAYRFRRVRELLMPLVAAVKAVQAAGIQAHIIPTVHARNIDDLAEYVRLAGRQLAEEALAEEAPVAGPGRSRGEGAHTP